MRLRPAPAASRLDAFPDCSDPELLDWITGGCEPPREHDHDTPAHDAAVKM
jgi:succinate dehydrogenase flavin-adding protein (antitoxin of CptAB toxin-antitoxin module)